MRVFLSILAITFCSLAAADTRPDTVIWSCRLAASLKGDGEFFMRYGRDSWKGNASLICNAGLRTERKDVQITYNGARYGFGVNESSVIAMSMDIITSNVPANFEVYAYVFNRDKPAIVWRNESAGILIEANIVSDDSPGVQNSLQQGNLFIR